MRTINIAHFRRIYCQPFCSRSFNKPNNNNKNNNNDNNNRRGYNYIRKIRYAKRNVKKD